MVAKKAALAFQLGERVRVRHWPNWRGEWLNCAAHLDPEVCKSPAFASRGSRSRMTLSYAKIS